MKNSVLSQRNVKLCLILGDKELNLYLCLLLDFVRVMYGNGLDGENVCREGCGCKPLSLLFY